MKKLLLVVISCFAIISANAWNVYFTNPKDWSEVYAYCYGGDGEVLGEWPGTEMTQSGDLWTVEGTGVPTNIIFNNNNGTQTGDLIFTEGGTYNFNGLAGDDSAPEMLYVMGNIVGNDWNPAAAVEADSAVDGVFTFTSVELANEGLAYFTFINELNDDWGVINNGLHRYGPAEGQDASVEAGDVAEFALGGDTSFNIPDGTYDFVVDFNTMTLSITGEESSSSTPKEPKWAVVGYFCNWNLADAVYLDNNGSSFSVSMDYLTPGFKIVDVNSNWDVQYGFGYQGDNVNPIKVNTKYTLDGKINGDDPNEIVFPFTVQSLSNVTINWNPDTYQLEVVVADSNIEYSYPDLYITGTFNDWIAPGEEGTVKGVEEGGVYTFLVDFGQSDVFIYFKVAGENYVPQAAGNIEISNIPVTVAQGGDNLYTGAEGLCQVIFDSNNMTMCIVPAIYVVGDDLNGEAAWDAVEANLMEYDTESATYIWNGSRISGGFKFNNGSWNTGYNIGAPEGAGNIEWGKKFTVVNEDGSENITLAEDTYVLFPTLELNLDKMTVEFVGGSVENSTPYVPEVVYLRGSFDEWADGITLEPTESGVYTGSATLEASAEGFEFKVDAGNDRWFGYVEGQEEVTLENNVPALLAMSATGGNWTLTEWEGGVLIATVDWSAKTLTLTATFENEEPGDQPEGPDGPSAVSSLESDSADQVIYNLQGVRVDNNKLTKGIYIINGKKVVVK